MSKSVQSMRLSYMNQAAHRRRPGVQAAREAD